MHFVRGVAGYSHAAPLEGVLVLAMAASCGSMTPAVLLDEFDEVADLHEILVRGVPETSLADLPASIRIGLNDSEVRGGSDGLVAIAPSHVNAKRIVTGGDGVELGLLLDLICSDASGASLNSRTVSLDPSRTGRCGMSEVVVTFREIGYPEVGCQISQFH